jgi:hypothetical protein
MVGSPQAAQGAPDPRGTWQAYKSQISRALACSNLQSITIADLHSLNTEVRTRTQPLYFSPCTQSTLSECGSHHGKDGAGPTQHRTMHRTAAHTQRTRAHVPPSHLHERARPPRRLKA